MSQNVFLIDDHHGFVEMREQPYDSEDLLQRLLADYPTLLADGATSKSSQLILIRREAAVPETQGGHGRWSLDHLFLDQVGVPTLVEVKRSSDTRIRREVIGQMLDYAAHAVTTWTADKLRADFEATCRERDKDPEPLIQNLVGNDDGTESFWLDVDRNLQAGRIRMVFVADEIPREVQQVVEFLNGQMNPAEVLAIEVKQYLDPVRGLRTLVPRLVGRTIKALEKKSGNLSPLYPGDQWDEEKILNAFSEKKPSLADTAKRVIQQARQHGLHEGYEGGSKKGSMRFGVTKGSKSLWLLYLHSSGSIAIGFDRVWEASPFDIEGPRHEHLRSILMRIPGSKESNKRYGKIIDLGDLTADTSIDTLFEAVDFIVQEFS